MPAVSTYPRINRRREAVASESHGLWGALQKPWVQDTIAGGLLLAAVFLLLSLGSFHPDDPSYFHYHPGVSPRNIGGVLGSTLSELLFQTVGIAGFLVPAFLALWCIAWALRSTRGYHVRLALALPLAVTATSIVAQIGLPRGLVLPAVAPGGAIGSLLASALLHHVSVGGTSILLGLMFTSSFIAISGLGPREFFLLMGAATWHSGGYAKLGVLWLFGVASSFLRGFFDGPGYSWSDPEPRRPAVTFEEDEPDDDEEDLVEEPEPEASSPTPAMRTLSARELKRRPSAEPPRPITRTDVPRPIVRKMTPTNVQQPVEATTSLSERLQRDLESRIAEREARETPPHAAPVAPTREERQPFPARELETRERAARENIPEDDAFSGWPFNEQDRPVMGEPVSMNMGDDDGAVAEEPRAPESEPVEADTIEEEPSFPDEEPDWNDTDDSMDDDDPQAEMEGTEENSWSDDEDEFASLDNEDDVASDDLDESEEEASAQEAAASDAFSDARPDQDDILGRPKVRPRAEIEIDHISEFEVQTPVEADHDDDDEGDDEPVADVAEERSGPTIRPRAETSYDEFLTRAEEDYDAQEDHDEDADEDDSGADDVPWHDDDDKPFQGDATVGLQKEAAAPMVLPSELDDADDDLPEPPPSIDEKNSEVQNILAKSKILVPGCELLNPIPDSLGGEPEEVLLDNADTLEKKLIDFKIDGRVDEIVPGPVITRYEYVPAAGVKVSRIMNLNDDLSMALKCKVPPRIAVIPGKNALGIEVPNTERELVSFTEIVRSKEFRNAKSPLTMAIGKDTEGNPFVTDLAAMPHLLVAGTTGSGKSVCINTILMSLIMFRSPLDVQLILVDPKMLELSIYNDIPHLRAPVVTDPARAATALQWAVQEMEDRYGKLSAEGVRNIKQYNQYIRELAERENWSEVDLREALMPYLVIIIDELADLMTVASNEVETSLMRLAQMARAAGIHLILATQRPSVDVITGVIKANFPSRLAFRVSQKVDSRTIIDEMGADRLLGNGDMLLRPPGTSRLLRLHGAYISEDEINRVVDFWKEQQLPTFHGIFEEDDADGGEGAEGLTQATQDEFFVRAVELIVAKGHASISMLQRRFRVGYARAARLVDMMERHGIVGKFEGSKPREVLVDESFVRRLKKMEGGG